MPDTVSKSVLVSLLPPGPIWIPAQGEDFDLLLDGIAANSEIMRTFLDSMAYLRDPASTTILADLEKEFGLFPDPGATERDRRSELATVINSSRGTGSSDYMQTKLRAAGFDVFVHENNPPIDPDIILDAGYMIYCNGDDAYCGHENALAGKSSGLLVINGDSAIDESFSTPASSNYFQLINFVGGAATRNATTDALEIIVPAQIPIARAEALIRLIMRYKPMHVWTGLMVEFI